MERKEREKETRRAPQAGVHMTVHDLTAEELILLKALRDPRNHDFHTEVKKIRALSSP